MPTDRFIHFLQFRIRISPDVATVSLVVGGDKPITLFKRSTPPSGVRGDLARTFAEPRITRAPAEFTLIHEVALPERTSEPRVLEAMARATTAHLGRFGWTTC